jgi:glycerol-3-phosphate dehydrogenase (NAD(P)+)
MRKLAILGGGSWGLTLAWLLADGAQSRVCLWDRNEAKITAWQANREIQFPLALRLPADIELCASLQEAVQDADVILLVVTTAGTRQVLQRLRDEVGLAAHVVLVNASKGIEFPSLKRMSEVFSEELPNNPYAVLSGPTLAREILSGLPTACSIACRDSEIAEQLQHDLSHERFRLYSNSDVTGVELGGALKNIFAIASGYLRTKQLGDNAWGALLTRGLAEMTRFATSLGAENQTLYGMSGLGDLLATANSPLSRNYQVGMRLAEGESLEHILSDLKVVAEGVKTTYAVAQLMDQMQLECPVVKMVQTCLEGPFSADMIIKSLMTRKLKSEEKPSISAKA